MNNYRFEELLEELKVGSDEQEKETLEVSTELAKIIGDLTNARIKQNLSQRQLSEKCGIKQSAIARMESLQVVPRLDTVLKIAYHLDLKLDFVSKTEQNINISFVFPQIKTNKSYSYNNSFASSISYTSDQKELVYGTIG